MNIFTQLHTKYTNILQNNDPNVIIKLDNITRMIYRVQEELDNLEYQIQNNDIKCTSTDKDEYDINQKADHIVNTICLPLVALYLVQENISEDKVKSTDDIMSSSFLKTSDK